MELHSGGVEFIYERAHVGHTTYRNKKCLLFKTWFVICLKPEPERGTWQS